MLHRLERLKLVTGIMQILVEHEITEVEPRHINAIIDAAQRICDEFWRESNPSKPGEGLASWIASDDVGASSLFMARRLAPLADLQCPPHRIEDRRAVPQDVDDFGRCVRLLESVPELRPHLSEMRIHGREWELLVLYWDALADALCRDAGGKTAPALFRRIMEAAK